MKDKIISALVKLALCPGKFDPESDVCSKCTYNKKEEPLEDCEYALRRDCTQLLKEGQNQQPTEDQGLDLLRRISMLLKEIGVPTHILGYSYLRGAIAKSIQDPSVMEGITSRLYPEVAEEFRTTPSRVERAIRHAIEVAWDRGDLDTLQRFFGYTVSNTKGKPTSGEFISCLAEYIQLELDRC